MMTCRELAGRAGRGELDGLGFWAALDVRLHLLICAGCRRLKREFALIARAVRRAAQPSPERVGGLEARLLGLLSRG